jgi:hypothetical protein
MKGAKTYEAEDFTFEFAPDGCPYTGPLATTDGGRGTLGRLPRASGSLGPRKPSLRVLLDDTSYLCHFLTAQRTGVSRSLKFLKALAGLAASFIAHAVALKDEPTGGLVSTLFCHGARILRGT